MFVPIHPQTRKRLNEVAARLGVPTPVAAALLLRVAASALGRAPESGQPEQPEHEPEVGRDG